MVTLPWFGDAEATDRAIQALHDRSAEVRKEAAKAIVGIDDPRCEKAMRAALAQSSRGLARRIGSGLKIMADIDALRRAVS